MVGLVFEEPCHRDAFLTLWQPLADHVRAEESGTLAFELLQLDTEQKELLVFERCAPVPLLGCDCDGQASSSSSGTSCHCLQPADSSIGRRQSHGRLLRLHRAFAELCWGKLAAANLVWGTLLEWTGYMQRSDCTTPPCTHCVRPR